METTSCVCVCARSIVHVALTSMSEIRRKFARQVAMVYPKDFQKFLEPCSADLLQMLA